jgi:hypothetical protein
MKKNDELKIMPLGTGRIILHPIKILSYFYIDTLKM